MAQWLTLDFARDLNVTICKDTGEQVTREGEEWLLGQLKKSPPNSIALRGVRMGHQAAVVFAKKLEEVGVPVLDLTENSIKDMGLSALLRYSEKNPSFVKLCVGCNDVTADGAQAIAECLLGGQSKLEVLELGFPNGREFAVYRGKSTHKNKIGPVGLQLLGRALSANNTLRYLGLSQNGLCEGQEEQVQLAMNIFSQMLAQNTSLREMDFTSNGLGNQGAISLFRGLTQNKSIMGIELADNDISAQAIPLLSTLIMQEDCQIEYIGLSGNPIGPVGAKSIAYGLSQNFSIQTFNLENCQLGDEGVGLLTEVLARPLVRDQFDSCLRAVTGRDEHFDQSDQVFQLLQTVSNEVASKHERQVVIVNAFGKVIHRLELSKAARPGLQKLSKDLSRSSAMGLTSPVQENESLEQRSRLDDVDMSSVSNLNLAGNGFTIKALKFVNRMIASPLALRTLNLRGNRLNFEGCFQLAQALIGGAYDLKAVLEHPNRIHQIADRSKVHQYLSSINIAQTGVNDDGYLVLTFALCALPCMAQVNFSNNYIGERGGELALQYIVRNQQLTQFSLQNNQVNHSTQQVIEKLLNNNRERILQNGPDRLMRQNADLKQQVQRLPETIQECNYYAQSNEQLKALIMKVSCEQDDIFMQMRKAIENVQQNIRAAAQQIEKTKEKIVETGQETESLNQKLGSLKEVQKANIDEETRKLAEIEATARQKQEEVDQIKNKRDQFIAEQKELIQQNVAATAKTAETMRLAQKIIELLKIKHQEVVSRVLASSSVGALCFGMDYNEVVGVVQRMQTVTQGQTIISEPSGYDLEKAYQAGSVAEKRAKSQSKNPKKKAK